MYEEMAAYSPEAATKNRHTIRTLPNFSLCCLAVTCTIREGHAFFNRGGTVKSKPVLGETP